MNTQAYLLLLLGLVFLLVCVLGIAVFRLLMASRDARRRDRGGTETAFVTAALQEAVGKLRDQERALQARAEASERLSVEIVAGLTAGLLLVDVSGDVRMVNPAAARLLGLGPGSHGGPFRDLLATWAPLAEVVDESLRRAAPILRRTVELRPTGAADGPTHLGVSVSPVFDEHRHLQAVVCLFSDLSAVVALEEQVRLKDGLARLGELTAGLAHEFRNGLATIHGYARLMEPADLPAPYAACVEGIRNETQALGEVVDKFLGFARPATLAVAPVDVQALASRAASEIRSDVVARGGEVIVAGEFGFVEGDEVLLRQALSNLCRNALEACVVAGRPPAIELLGSVDRSRDVLRITVTDNGPGIDPADRDRVFQPFFTTKSAGTGLGLALVQKIVVTHNGRVSVSEAPGGGARFHVALPLRAGSPAMAAAT